MNTIQRPRWEDLEDTSTESNESPQKDQSLAALVTSSQASYQMSNDGSKDGKRASLPGHLQRAAVLDASPPRTSSAEPAETTTASTSGEVSTPSPAASKPLPSPARFRIRHKRSARQGGGTTKRRKEDDEEQPPASPCAAAAPSPPANGAGPVASEAATEKDWERRIAKRELAVRLVKKMPEYQAYATARDAAGVVALSHSQGSVPKTPRVQDREVSKRAWESSVQDWKSQIRQWWQEHGQP